jgi:hypothetical protein
LGVYVIIAYYADASKSPNFKNKITNQMFDIKYIKQEINKLLYYQSDALHWNLSQLDRINKISEKALQHYKNISKKLKVKMHSWESAKKRIMQISKSKETFMELSRQLAEKAQKRERITIQPKEQLKGIKATITIKNYLGGLYYFTCDEVEIHGKSLYLIEGKHTKRKELPSLEDIKDGLLKMILFTNLKHVKIKGKRYNSIPVLKLTTAKHFDIKDFKELINQLKNEAKRNSFKLLINKKFIV